jgi:sterol desaturase/sphingolipid hydroxylase (fatty acid hydroxylase superfamily)
VQLNYAEKMWAAWYAYMQNDVLATGIMSFVMHELVYFGRSLPWIIADRLPWLNKYKIQNVRPAASSFIFLLPLLPLPPLQQECERKANT